MPCMTTNYLSCFQVGEAHIVENVRRNREPGSLIGSDGSAASMHGEHVELYSEEDSSTGEEEEEEEEDEEDEEVMEHGTEHDASQPTVESVDNRPPTAGMRLSYGIL